MKRPVSLPPLSPTATFTTAERALIRQAFGMHFGQYPRVADGILLRIRRSGPEAGQPKLPPAVKTMVERKLMEVRPGQYGSRAFFTKAGLAALRALTTNYRFLNPDLCEHIGRELAAMQENNNSKDVVKNTANLS
jgi:hypothetical protein